MIKILARTLVILAVCGLIATGVYALVQANPSAGASGGRPEFQPQANLAGQAPPFEGRHEGGRGGDENQGSIFGLAGVVRSILVIGIITLIVNGLQRLFSRRATRRAALRAAWRARRDNPAGPPSTPVNG